ncbi:MAG TPA: M20/M25/M40 family metallo-hydrolase, partial [Anaerolineae bacterium]|nr:M20/M25/M40 family metallo-hydrolase [Anaerolineae bacterium]
ARAAALAERGAAGLVVVTDRELDTLQAERLRSALRPTVGIPVFEITEEAFGTLLGRLGVGERDLVTSPPALPLGVRVRQSLARSPLTTTLTANVLGMWPGNDPELADEVLIVGAHYDHIGRSPDGVLFPGANHNGSGVAALLEMARVWREAGYRPARSVLFVAWGAEELGSAGVAHYLTHPVVPLTRTVGVIALDGVGGGRGYKLLYYGTREHDLPLIQRLEAGAALLDRRAWRRGSTGEGWHAAFNAGGVPTVKLIWDEAERDFYLPTDTVDRIDPDRLASTGETLTLTVAWLAGR